MFIFREGLDNNNDDDIGTAQTFSRREKVHWIEAIVCLVDAQKTFPSTSTKHNIPLTLTPKLDERRMCRATRSNTPRLAFSHPQSFPIAALDMCV